MRHHSLRRVLGAVAVVIVALSSSPASQPNNYGLNSYDTFTLQYTTFSGTKVQVTDQDAYIPKYRFPYLNFLVTLFHIKIPGSNPQKEVWVGAFADPVRHVHFMGCFHPFGVPPGWRVDHIEQEFELAFVTPPNMADQRFAVPKVYGPTFYRADQPARVLEAYPTFLQTQQITLEDRLNGGCISIAANDDAGRRKKLGFESDGTATGAKFLVQYIPEQGLLDPLPILWLAPYQMTFGYLLAGFEAALDWYRNEQLIPSRPNSFLRSRLPASQTIHPDVRDSMFAIGVGAVFSTVTLPNGQFDISADYRTDVLDYFSGVHGRHLQLYHLGWYSDSPDSAMIMPDDFGSITPGHRALIAQAKAHDDTIRSVGYTLPGVLHPSSAHYDSSLIRLEKDGSLNSLTLAEQPGQTYRYCCYYPNGTSNVLTSLYVNDVLGSHGFSGAYLDALSAWPTCHGHLAHGHPLGENEQLSGIDRFLRDVRGGVQSRRQYMPMLFNETPTDSLRTDGSGLDVFTWDEDYWNIFAMTYSGEEWPTYSAVFGWDATNNVPSGLEYTRELANCLAGGARPLIIWPEVAGRMPTDPSSDPEFAEFLAMLNDYVTNWDTFWRDVIFGRRFEPLTSNELLGPTIDPMPVQPLVNGDPVTDAFRLPGYRTKSTGGSYPSRMRGRGSMAFVAGICEPLAFKGRRCVPISRWASRSMAVRMKLPPTHPLYQQTMTATLNVSAKNLKAKPGALLRAYHVASRQWVSLGRLSTVWNEKRQFKIDFSDAGTIALVVD